MKEMLETIAKYLVNNPDQVTVTEVEGEQSVILELRVAQEDMGRVIGKEGKIAKAIRTLVKANAAKLNNATTCFRYIFKSFTLYCFNLNF